MASKLTPAASYIRMSSDRQEKSPAEQRRENATLAERHKCSIVAEYADEGISGDEHNRPDFQRMLDDAEAGKFEVILNFDQDRFSRFDILDAAEYWRRLRNAGVKLITANQGELDFDDFKSVLLATINQHGNHEFLAKLASRVCVGHRDAAEAGRWVNGAAPFGYKIGEDKKLVPDPSRADIVKAMFNDVLTRPINQIAGELNRRGVKPPRAAVWSPVGVLNMLENEAYIGTLIHGENACGKYGRLISGEVTKVPRSRQGKPMRQARRECIVVKNAHPAIIDAELFYQVQDTIKGRKVTKRRPREATNPLTGIAVCGHCGKGLYGHWQTLADGTKSLRYLCQSRHRGGLAGPECGFSLRGDDLHGLIINQLVARWLSEEKLAARQAAVEKVCSTRKKTFAGRRDELTASIAEIDAQIKRAEDRLLYAFYFEVAPWAYGAAHTVFMRSASRTACCQASMAACSRSS